MTELAVGGRIVGGGAPPLVIAEVGINHNGDMALAHGAIDAVARAGAEACKFQSYRVEDFISDGSLTYSYVSQGREVSEAQIDLFDRCQLSSAQLAELAEHCRAAGLLFISTPTSSAGVSELVSLGADGIKNGSDYLTDLSLVAAMAASQVPTILSTGMATLAEIDDAVRTFRGAEGDQLVVLHCTSTYPTAMVDVHLRKIPTLAAAFDVAVGLSDHTDGSVAAIGAVALGAVVIEKHFTLDKGLPGPDHHFSADERELAVLVRAVQDAHAALGGTRIGPTEAEEAGRVAFRLSCVAAEDLPAGRRLRVDDIALRRPGSGLPPSGSGWLIGRELLADVPRGHVFATGDFR